MAQKTRAELKAFFETGDKPTQQQFSDWLDSYFHKDDTISTDNINGLQLILDEKANKAHIHIAEMTVSPTGAAAEANSVRMRIDGVDAVLESTANGADWIELQRWSRD